MRAEKKNQNFGTSLPEHLAEQVDEMLKSRYHLEFLGLKRGMKEREMEDRLADVVQDGLHWQTLFAGIHIEIPRWPAGNDLHCGKYPP